jgi:hypothetical protein
MKRLVGFAAAGVLTLALPSAATAAPPANDNFANATTVGPGLPVSVPSTSVEATAEPGEPPHGFNPANRSIWFRWTPAVSASVVISSCDPDLNFGQIGVHTGSAVNALATVAVAGECQLRFNAVSGTTYLIAVDGLFNQQAFNFVVRPISPPANDNFASAQTVGPALPVAVPGTTVDSSTEAGEPVASGGPGGRSVWYRWAAPSNVQVRADFCDFRPVFGAGNRRVAVYTGSSLAALGAPVVTSMDCRVTFDAVAGTTYRIAFSGAFGGEGPFTFRLLQTTPPANDDFANAQAVGPGLPVLVQASNEFATIQAGEPSHGAASDASFPPNDSVWFKWTPSASVLARVGVCDSTENARLGVYTGASVNALTRVTPAETINSFPFCAFRFNAVAGTTYFIAAGSPAADDEGTFTLDIHVFQPPANDAFATPQLIGGALPATINGSNVDSSAQAGEPDHTEDTPPSRSVWYSWTPAASTPVALDTCTSDFFHLLAVYTGSTLASLDQVALGQGGCGPGPGARTQFPAVAGTTYLIVVDGTFEQEGAFTLRLSDPTFVPPPPVEVPAFDLKSALRKCKKIKRKAARKKCISKAKKRVKRA